MKLVAYLRVSTERQVHAFGLKAQRREIREWAKANGHRVVDWFADEGISGSNGIDTRVGLYDAISEVQSGRASGVVFTSLDRLARQMTEQEGILAEIWKSSGVVFSTGDGGEVLEDDPDDPMRTAIRQMRGVFAQLERGLIRQRMAKGRREKAAQGGYIGGAPRFGHRADGKGGLAVDEDEREAVERIVQLRTQGASLRSIVATLADEGIDPKRGGWHPTSIARVLEREQLSA